MSDDDRKQAEFSLEPPPLWTGADLMDAMNARPVNGMPDRVEGISIDSRSLEKGDAFFAISGDKFDGHQFASKAAAAGASVLVVAERKLPMLGRVTIPMMVVEDVLEALRLVGRAARARTKARIVAITGSAGKTTTKEALRHVLEKQGRVHASPASFNNHWGVPLTLARMPANTQFGVFEIGMNHHGEIGPLVRLVRPHVAVVTVIAGAHLGHFKDLEDIAVAKSEIFEGVVPGGTALINQDDPRFALLSERARSCGIEKVCGFGAHRGADVHLVKGEFHDRFSVLSTRVFNQDVPVKVSVPGRHIAQNMLAVLGVVSRLGGDVVKAGDAMAGLDAGPGRGARHELDWKGGKLTVIDESYNANPGSMEAALETLARVEVPDGGRRIAVLGDMLEMGEHSAKVHAELAGPLRDNAVDIALLGGEEMAALAAVLDGKPVHEYRESLDALMALVEETVRAGDAVMVKSSNGLGFSRIVKMLVDKSGQ